MVSQGATERKPGVYDNKQDWSGLQRMTLVDFIWMLGNQKTPVINKSSRDEDDLFEGS